MVEACYPLLSVALRSILAGKALIAYYLIFVNVGAMLETGWLA